jgi:hypothetical protein
MKRLLVAVALGLVCSIGAVPAFAAKPNKTKSPAARLEKKLASADLSSEAREKAKKTIEQHAAKLKEAQAKVDAVLTKEQMKARRQAVKEATAAGKKGKEARAAALAALKLTDEQKTKLESAEAGLKAAQTALTKDLQTALTKDDLEKLGLKARKKKA